MTKIKICGITNEEDALWAANLGADFIGLNFWPETKRSISISLASKIIEKIPSFVQKVAIFVDQEISYIKRVVKNTQINFIQLHGNESIDYIKKLKDKLDFSPKIIKAFRVKGEEILEEIIPYQEIVDFFLLDTYIENNVQPGGSGISFNLDYAVKVREKNIQFFLSGGLTPENVFAAVKKVRPYGVDVASGVEITPRKKDYYKMKEFIQNVRRADNET